LKLKEEVIEDIFKSHDPNSYKMLKYFFEKIEINTEDIYNIQLNI